MASPTGKATTFGLELEFNLAFTECKLLSTLSRHQIPFKHIQKHHTAREHDSLLCMNSDFSHTCRTEYPAWTVIATLDADDVYCNPLLTTAFYNTICPETKQSLRGRGYIAEPLLIAQDLLRQGNLPAEIRAVINPQCEVPIPLHTNQAVETAAESSDNLLSPSADYTRWTLTNDYTLISGFKSQLLSQLPSKINTSNVDGWDSHGIELISPIFNLKRQKAAFAEVESYLSALASSNGDVGTLTSTWAGLHVHIGFDVESAPDVLLRTLQWLAVLLLSHEDLITSLFPSHCCGLDSVMKEPEEPEDSYVGLSDHEYEAMLAEEEEEEEDDDDDDEQEQDEKTVSADTQKTSLAAVETETEEVALRASSTPTSTSESGSERSVNIESTAHHTKTTACPNITTMPSPNATTTFHHSQTPEDQRVLQAESNFTNHQSKLSNARYLASVLNQPHPLSASTIYEAVFKPDQTVSSLIRLSQKPKNTKNPDRERYRGYMYNFSNIEEYIFTYMDTDAERRKGKGRGKPTVEFRQHECTIDAKAIGMWVRFIEGVMRKAGTLADSHICEAGHCHVGEDRYAKENRDGAGREYGKKTRKKKEEEEQKLTEQVFADLGFEVHTDIRRFCTLIGLNEEEGQYWVERRERFARNYW